MKSISMIRKILLMTIISVLGFTNVYGEGTKDNIDLYINNQAIYDNLGGVIIENDTSLVPLRLVSEKLGAVVDYNKDNKQITITKDDVNIILTLDSNEAIINNETVKISSPPSIYHNSVTYVPLRLISEGLDQVVNYNKDYHFINIYSKDNPAYKALKSEDLFTARCAALSMSNCAIGASVMGSEVSFPIGKSDAFFRYDCEPNVISYYELIEGVWCWKWSGHYEFGEFINDNGKEYLDITGVVSDDGELPPYKEDDAFITFYYNGMFQDYPDDIKFYEQNGLAGLNYKGNYYKFTDEKIAMNPFDHRVILEDTKDQEIIKYLDHLEAILDENNEISLDKLN